MISIVVPVYNKEKYIEECVDSIVLSDISQKIEIILVDDDSNDNSYNILEQYNKIDEIKVIKNEYNMGLSKTRNIGIENSIGEFIVCLDADDKIPKNYLQANYDNIVYGGVDISYTNSQCFDGSDKLYNWPEFDIEKLRRFPFINASAMFKKEVWEKVGGFDESFIYGSEDYDFWLSAAKNGFKFKKCRQTVLFYRVVEDGMLNSVSSNNKDLIDKMLKDKYNEFYLGGLNER